MHRLAAILTVLCIAACLGLSVKAQDPLPQASAEDRAEALAIFKQLIEINTTDTPQGNVTTATTAMQKRFLDAGFAPEDVHLLGPDARKKNLVVRYPRCGHANRKARGFSLPHGRGAGAALGLDNRSLSVR